MRNELRNPETESIGQNEYESLSTKAQMVLLLREIAENAELAVLHIKAYEYDPVIAGSIIHYLERKNDELKTIMGQNPASTGSRRSRLCDNYAVRMLCRNPGTRSLMGCDLDAKAPAGAGLGDEGNAT